MHDNKHVVANREVSPCGNENEVRLGLCEKEKETSPQTTWTCVRACVRAMPCTRVCVRCALRARLLACVLTSHARIKCVVGRNVGPHADGHCTRGTLARAMSRTSTASAAPTPDLSNRRACVCALSSSLTATHSLLLSHRQSIRCVSLATRCASAAHSSASCAPLNSSSASCMGNDSDVQLAMSNGICVGEFESDERASVCVGLKD
jgi:hypothetical protein